MINRCLAGNRILPRLVWENVKPNLAQVEAGYVTFDFRFLDLRLTLRLKHSIRSSMACSADIYDSS